MFLVFVGTIDIEFIGTIENKGEKMDKRKEEMKKKLIEMAKSGKKRPISRSKNIEERKLGALLLSYTRSNSSNYDPEFDKEIRTIKSDWFVDIAERRKEELIEMAESGKDRPKQRTHKLGAILSAYTNSKNRCYDPKFIKKIKKIRPDWFASKSDIAKKRKEELLEMAKSGKDRPKRNTNIGRSSFKYTNLNSPYYDHKFTSNLKKIRPDWFITQSEKVKKNKEQLLEMAKNGEDKPGRTTKFVLSNYVCKVSGSYDRKFDRKIRRIKPEWFEKGDIEWESYLKKNKNSSFNVPELIDYKVKGKTMKKAKLPTSKTYIENSWSNKYGKSIRLSKKLRKIFDDTRAGIEPFNPFDWQMECFNDFRDSKYNILNAVMGSGKSIAMAILNHYWLKKDHKKKALIVIPQLMIGSGFKDREVVIKGEIITLDSTILSSDDQDSTVKELRNFLEMKISIVDLENTHKRSLVCTHQTLVALFESCTYKEKKKLFKNLIIWVDEAHHCGTEAYKDMNDEELFVVNGLTKVVEFMIDQDYPVNLTTATLFRGDGEQLLRSKYIDKFKRFDFSFDRYMDECCKFLKNINYNWVMFSGDYYNGIKAAFSKDPHQKTIIYLPFVGTKHSETRRGKESSEREKSKDKEVHKIIKSIYPGFDPKKHSDIHPVHKCKYYKIKVKGKMLQIVDMVKQAGRDKVMKYIQHENTKSNPEIDIIVALGTFKEGADYSVLERCIVVDKRQSMVELVQMIGRIFRDFPGKKKAHIYHLLPIQTKEAYDDDKEFTQALNMYVNQYIYSLLLDDMFAPKIMNFKVLKGDSKGKYIKKESLWNKNLGPRKSAEIMNDIYNEYQESKVSLDNRECFKSNFKLAKKICKRMLEDEGITNQKLINDMFVEFQNKLWKRNKKMNIILKENLELMNGVDLFGDLQCFVAKGMGSKTWKEFRKKHPRTSFSFGDLSAEIIRVIKLTGDIPKLKNAKKTIEIAAAKFCMCHKISRENFEKRQKRNK